MTKPDHVEQHRAKYHPVVDVEALIANTSNGRKVRVVTKRCIESAKLWDGLTDAQQNAAEHIHKGYTATHGSPLKARNYLRQIMPNGRGLPAEVAAQWRSDYFAWQGECMWQGLDFRIAVLVCGEALSVQAVAGSSGQRRAKATEELHAALDVMAKLKGWK